MTGVLVANKLDVPEAKRKVSSQEGKDKAEFFGMPFFESSAKRVETITPIFEEVVRQVWEARKRPKPVLQQDGRKKPKKERALKPIKPLKLSKQETQDKLKKATSASSITPVDDGSILKGFMKINKKKYFLFLNSEFFMYYKDDKTAVLTKSKLQIKL